MPSFFTIGHSNRSVDEFVELLRAADVQRIVDVRAFPRSRAQPQFNIDTLPDNLALHDVTYEHVATLGGRRGKSSAVPPAVNGFWTHQSFHNYADYALSGAFHGGLEHLIRIGHEYCCAVMCSEAVWWRCHRRIIADYLIARGEPVFHILALDNVDTARLTEGARVQPDGTITYPVVSPSVL
jgi:uncharacterized protein (DUF488 family)